LHFLTPCVKVTEGVDQISIVGVALKMTQNYATKTTPPVSQHYERCLHQHCVGSCETVKRAEC